MTKLVLSTQQVPDLVGRSSGDVVVMTLYTTVEGAEVSEEGYVTYVLDVKSVETQDAPVDLADAARRAQTQLTVESYPG